MFKLQITLTDDPYSFVIPQIWEIIGDLGDGAFGKVHKVRHRQRPDALLAAGKICVLETEDELSDFMVEIDILAEVSHDNIIKLYEAYFWENKLWVSARDGWKDSSAPLCSSLIYRAAQNVAVAVSNIISISRLCNFGTVIGLVNFVLVK